MDRIVRLRPSGIGLSFVLRRWAFCEEAAEAFESDFELWGRKARRLA
jgi:hypothetical protein